MTTTLKNSQASSRNASPALVIAVLAAWGLGVLLLLLYLEHQPHATTASETPASANAVFPAPRPGAVVFSREAGPDALAVAVAPGRGRLGVQASIVGPDGLGVSGLTASFAVDGVAADGVACGAGCYRGTVPASARPRTVELRTEGQLSTRWHIVLPRRWPPENAAQMLARARRVWRGLRSVSYAERLASSPVHVSTSQWRIQAPDRLAYQIVNGYSAVVIGNRRWDRAPGGRWVRSPQQRLTQPTPLWTFARNAYVLGAARAYGRGALKVTFFDPRIPAWFTIALDRKTLRTLDARMVATAHFMHDAYRDFNATPEIHPPPHGYR